MLRKIEYLIPAALEAVDAVLVAKYGKDKIPAGYQSAVSGFGTTLLQMGLLPTLAVYTDKDSGAGIERDQLLKALLRIVKHKDSRFPEEKKSMIPDQVGAVLKEVAKREFPQQELKEHLLQAAVAFKLAIRTYKLKKS